MNKPKAKSPVRIKQESGAETCPVCKHEPVAGLHYGIRCGSKCKDKFRSTGLKTYICPTGGVCTEKLLGLPVCMACRNNHFLKSGLCHPDSVVGPGSLNKRESSSERQTKKVVSMGSAKSRTATDKPPPKSLAVVEGKAGTSKTRNTTSVKANKPDKSEVLKNSVSSHSSAGTSALALISEMKKNLRRKLPVAVDVADENTVQSVPTLPEKKKNSRRKQAIAAEANGHVDDGEDVKDDKKKPSRRKQLIAGEASGQDNGVDVNDENTVQSLPALSKKKDSRRKKSPAVEASGHEGNGVDVEDDNTFQSLQTQVSKTRKSRKSAVVSISETAGALDSANVDGISPTTEAPKSKSQRSKKGAVVKTSLTVDSSTSAVDSENVEAIVTLPSAPTEVPKTKSQRSKKGAVVSTSLTVDSSTSAVDSENVEDIVALSSTQTEVPKTKSQRSKKGAVIRTSITVDSSTSAVDSENVETIAALPSTQTEVPKTKSQRSKKDSAVKTNETSVSATSVVQSVDIGSDTALTRATRTKSQRSKKVHEVETDVLQPSKKTLTKSTEVNASRTSKNESEISDFNPLSDDINVGNSANVPVEVSKPETNKGNKRLSTDGDGGTALRPMEVASATRTRSSRRLSNDDTGHLTGVEDLSSAPETNVAIVRSSSRKTRSSRNKSSKIIERKKDDLGSNSSVDVGDSIVESSANTLPLRSVESSARETLRRRSESENEENAPSSSTEANDNVTKRPARRSTIRKRVVGSENEKVVPNERVSSGSSVDVEKIRDRTSKKDLESLPDELNVLDVDSSDNEYLPENRQAHLSEQDAVVVKVVPESRKSRRSSLERRAAQPVEEQLELEPSKSRKNRTTSSSLPQEALVKQEDAKDTPETSVPEKCPCCNFFYVSGVHYGIRCCNRCRIRYCNMRRSAGKFQCSKNEKCTTKVNGLISCRLCLYSEMLTFGFPKLDKQHDGKNSHDEIPSQGETPQELTIEPEASLSSSIQPIGSDEQNLQSRSATVAKPNELIADNAKSICACCGPSLKTVWKYFGVAVCGKCKFNYSKVKKKDTIVCSGDDNCTKKVDGLIVCEACLTDQLIQSGLPSFDYTKINKVKGAKRAKRMSDETSREKEEKSSTPAKPTGKLASKKEEFVVESEPGCSTDGVLNIPAHHEEEENVHPEKASPAKPTGKKLACKDEEFMVESQPGCSTDGVNTPGEDEHFDLGKNSVPVKQTAKQGNTRKKCAVCSIAAMEFIFSGVSCCIFCKLKFLKLSKMSSLTCSKNAICQKKIHGLSTCRRCCMDHMIGVGLQKPCKIRASRTTSGSRRNSAVDRIKPTVPSRRAPSSPYLDPAASESSVEILAEFVHDHATRRRTSQLNHPPAPHSGFLTPPRTTPMETSIWQSFLSRKVDPSTSEIPFFPERLFEDITDFCRTPNLRQTMSALGDLFTDEESIPGLEDTLNESLDNSSPSKRDFYSMVMVLKGKSPVSPKEPPKTDTSSPAAEPPSIKPISECLIKEPEVHDSLQSSPFAHSPGCFDHMNIITSEDIQKLADNLELLSETDSQSIMEEDRAGPSASKKNRQREQVLFRPSPNPAETIQVAFGNTFQKAKKQDNAFPSLGRDEESTSVIETKPVSDDSENRVTDSLEAEPVSDDSENRVTDSLEAEPVSDDLEKREMHFLEMKKTKEQTDLPLEKGIGISEKEKLIETVKRIEQNYREKRRELLLKSEGIMLSELSSKKSEKKKSNATRSPEGKDGEMVSSKSPSKQERKRKETACNRLDETEKELDINTSSFSSLLSRSQSESETGSNSPEKKKLKSGSSHRKDVSVPFPEESDESRKTVQSKSKSKRKGTPCNRSDKAEEELDVHTSSFSSLLSSSQSESEAGSVFPKTKKLKSGSSHRKDVSMSFSETKESAESRKVEQSKPTSKRKEDCSNYKPGPSPLRVMLTEILTTSSPKEKDVTGRKSKSKETVSSSGCLVEGKDVQGSGKKRKIVEEVGKSVGKTSEKADTSSPSEKKRTKLTHHTTLETNKDSQTTSRSSVDSKKQKTKSVNDPSASVSPVKNFSHIDKSASGSPVNKIHKVDKSASESPRKNCCVIDKSSTGSPLKKIPKVDKRGSESSRKNSCVIDKSATGSPVQTFSEVEKSASSSPRKNLSGVDKSTSLLHKKNFSEIDKSGSGSPVKNLCEGDKCASGSSRKKCSVIDKSASGSPINNFSGLDKSASGSPRKNCLFDKSATVSSEKSLSSLPSKMGEKFFTDDIKIQISSDSRTGKSEHKRSVVVKPGPKQEKGKQKKGLEINPNIIEADSSTVAMKAENQKPTTSEPHNDRLSSVDDDRSISPSSALVISCDEVLDYEPDVVDSGNESKTPKSLPSDSESDSDTESYRKKLFTRRPQKAEIERVDAGDALGQTDSCEVSSSLRNDSPEDSNEANFSSTPPQDEEKKGDIQGLALNSMNNRKNTEFSIPAVKHKSAKPKEETGIVSRPVEEKFAVDNSLPTTKSAAKDSRPLCPTFMHTGRCRYKNNCKFKHEVPPQEPQQIAPFLPVPKEPEIKQEDFEEICRNGLLNKAVEMLTCLPVEYDYGAKTNMLMTFTRSALHLNQLSKLKTVGTIIELHKICDSGFLSDIVLLCEPKREGVRDFLQQLVRFCKEFNLVLTVTAVRVIRHAFAGEEPQLWRLVLVLYYTVVTCKHPPPMNLVQRILMALPNQTNQAQRLFEIMTYFPSRTWYELKQEHLMGFLDVLQSDKHCWEQAAMLEKKIQTMHVDTMVHDPAKWVQSVIEGGRWSELANQYRDFGQGETNFNVVPEIHDVLNKQGEQSAECYSHFVYAVTDDGKYTLTSHQHQLLGQIGTALMLENHHEKRFETAYQILKTLHQYNLDYYRLQKPALAQKQVHTRNGTMISPCRAVLVAVEICLEVKQYLAAVNVFQGYDWVQPSNQLLVDASYEEILWRARLLKTLAEKLFEMGDQLDLGIQAVKYLLATISEDLTDDNSKVTIQIIDVDHLYQDYMREAIKLEYVDEVLNLYEYYKKMDVLLYLSDNVLRALLILCYSCGKYSEAKNMFSMFRNMGIYEVNKPLPACKSLKVKSDLTNQEILLFINAFFEDLHKIFYQQTKVVFEERFAVNITITASSPSGEDEMDVLREITPSIADARERVVFVLQNLLEPPIAVSESAIPDMVTLVPQDVYDYFYKNDKIYKPLTLSLKTASPRIKSPPILQVVPKKPTTPPLPRIKPPPEPAHSMLQVVTERFARIISSQPVPVVHQASAYQNKSVQKIAGMLSKGPQKTSTPVASATTSKLTTSVLLGTNTSAQLSGIANQDLSFKIVASTCKNGNRTVNSPLLPVPSNPAGGGAQVRRLSGTALVNTNSHSSTNVLSTQKQPCQQQPLKPAASSCSPNDFNVVVGFLTRRLSLQKHCRDVNSRARELAVEFFRCYPHLKSLDKAAMKKLNNFAVIKII